MALHGLATVKHSRVLERNRPHLAEECRTLLCERGLLQRADGSARWSQDKTSVIAAVYGPRSTFGRKEDSEQAIVEVFFKPNAGLYRFSAPGIELWRQCILESTSVAGHHTCMSMHGMQQYA